MAAEARNQPVRDLVAGGLGDRHLCGIGAIVGIVLGVLALNQIKQIPPGWPRPGGGRDCRRSRVQWSSTSSGTSSRGADSVTRSYHCPMAQRRPPIRTPRSTMRPTTRATAAGVPIALSAADGLRIPAPGYPPGYPVDPYDPYRPIRRARYQRQGHRVVGDRTGRSVVLRSARDRGLILGSSRCVKAGAPARTATDLRWPDHHRRLAITVGGWPISDLSSAWQPRPADGVGAIGFLRQLGGRNRSASRDHPGGPALARRSPAPSCGSPRRSSRRRASPRRARRRRGRVALVGLENQLGAVVIGLARTEDLVRGVDLVGCSTHLPSKPSAAVRAATRRNPSRSRIFR